jgi:hypothetical protein
MPKPKPDGYIAIVAPFKFEEIRQQWPDPVEDTDDEGRRRLTATIDGLTWIAIEEPDHEKGMRHSREAYGRNDVVKPSARDRSDIRFRFGIHRDWRAPK